MISFTPSLHTAQFVVVRLCLVGLMAFSILPYFIYLQFFVEYPSSFLHEAAFVRNEVLGYALGVLGGTFYGHKIPERFARGHFDFIG